MTDEQLLQEAYDALCVALPGRQGLGEWEQNEPLRAALRGRLAQLASGQHFAQVTGFNVPVTFGGCPSCGRKDCVARACTRSMQPIASGQEPTSEREAFEAWCPYKGNPDPWIVWKAAWQAPSTSTAAAE
jgi:hypothetical protein